MSCNFSKNTHTLSSLSSIHEWILQKIPDILKVESKEYVCGWKKWEKGAFAKSEWIFKSNKKKLFLRTGDVQGDVLIDISLTLIDTPPTLHTPRCAAQLWYLDAFITYRDPKLHA